MSITLTVSDLLTGVGEFPPQTKLVLESLIQKSDRDKGLSAGLANWLNAAWERTVNDTRDMAGIDVTGEIGTTLTKLVQAMWAHTLMHMLWWSNRTHPDDTRTAEAKYHKAEYERIKARLDLLMPSGRISKAGQGNQLVRA